MPERIWAKQREDSLKDSRFLCINRKSGDICLYKTYAKNLSSRRRSAYRVCEKSQKKWYLQDIAFGQNTARRSLSDGESVRSYIKKTWNNNEEKILLFIKETQENYQKIWRRNIAEKIYGLLCWDIKESHPEKAGLKLLWKSWQPEWRRNPIL